MTINDFKLDMERLVKIFNPSDWDETREQVYYNVVRSWSAQEWHIVVDQMISGREFFPKPKNIIGARLALRTEERENNKPPDCSCCDRGLISFSIEYLGIQYDKVCACSCDAGKWHMLKRYGRGRMKSYLEIFNTEPTVITEIDQDDISDPIKQGQTPINTTKGPMVHYDPDAPTAF